MAQLYHNKTILVTFLICNIEIILMNEWDFLLCEQAEYSFKPLVAA